MWRMFNLPADMFIKYKSAELGWMTRKVQSEFLFSKDTP